MKQRYLGLITMVDRSIGGILSCLEQAELLDKTIIVHTSDHGDMLGAHHLFGKEVMFEEAVRVPYLVRLPGPTPESESCSTGQSYRLPAYVARSPGGA